MSHHETWLSLDEVINATNWNRATVFRKQASGELKSRPTDKKSANGKPIVEYAASSLPGEKQIEIFRQRMASNALVLASRSPHPIKQKVALATESERVAITDAKLLEKATYRYECILPLIEFANNTNGHKPVYRTANGDEKFTRSEIVAHVSRVTGNSQASLWNWWDRYLNHGGFIALANKARADRNTSRFFEDHQEAAEFVQGKYLSPKERLSARLVYRALKREWPRFRKDAEDELCSYTTLRAYLNKIPALITDVARTGSERGYKNDFAPFLRRDVSAVPVNAVWISDHVIHDVWTYNDGYFPELPMHKAFRPWLTCIADMRSRRTVGLAWCVTPSSRSISSALRVGLAHFGRPNVFYVDNGKDYLKVAKELPGLSPEAQGVLTRLGIKSQHCLPRHPQSKQIESFFHTLHQQFDVLWRPGYCGTSPKTRPEECDAAIREHERIVEAGEDVSKSPLVPVSKFIAAAAAWMDRYNNDHEHSGQGMDGHSPAQIFDAELPPATRELVDVAAIAPLFWDRQQRIVREGGTVQLHNAFYEPADGDSRAALMFKVKQEVLVAWDPMNPGVAIALDQDGHLLGQLRAQALLIHGDTDPEVIKDSLRERRRILTGTKQLIAGIHERRRKAGDLTEVEVLQKRLPASQQPNVHHALPVPRAVNAVAAPKRLHVDDIADSYVEE